MTPRRAVVAVVTVLSLTLWSSAAQAVNLTSRGGMLFDFDDRRATLINGTSDAWDNCYHLAVDVGGEEGSTVRAAADGIVAYANHADSDEANHYQGLSSIAAPDGAVLAAAPETGEYLILVSDALFEPGVGYVLTID